MTFKELSTLIHTEARADYARLLLTNSDTIIREVGKTTKGDVARGLKITPQHFTLVYRLILAHTDIMDELCNSSNEL